MSELSVFIWGRGGYLVNNVYVGVVNKPFYVVYLIKIVYMFYSFVSKYFECFKTESTIKCDCIVVPI